MRDLETGLPQSDQEFLNAFEACDLANESFRHRDHIRLAWIYLHHLSVGEASSRLTEAIRRFAAHAGKPEKYHHTITLAWIRLVVAARQKHPDAANGTEFVDANPALLDRNALLAHYSPAVIESERARQGWVEPDLARLP